MAEEDEEQEQIEEQQENSHKGYKCVKCESEVDIDPVEEKIICPVCSHRVLMKLRADQPEKVEAV